MLLQEWSFTLPFQDGNLPLIFRLAVSVKVTEAEREDGLVLHRLFLTFVPEKQRPSPAANVIDRRLKTYVEEKSPRRSTETSGNLFPKKTTSWLVSESQTASTIHWWRLCNLQQKKLKFVTFHDVGWVSISNTTFYKSNQMIRNIFLRHLLE